MGAEEYLAMEMWTFPPWQEQRGRRDVFWGGAVDTNHAYILNGLIAFTLPDP